MNKNVKRIPGHQTTLFRTTDGQEWLSRNEANKWQDHLDADPNAKHIFIFTSKMTVKARNEKEAKEEFAKISDQMAMCASCEQFM